MTTEERIAPPERPGGQGLDPNQEESGNRAIVALLTDPVHGPLTDLVITYRDGADPDSAGRQGAYEVWAQRGMVRFQRFLADGGPEGPGGYGYRVIEQIGENPVANQDPTALATLAEELEAGAKSGFSGTDPARAFVEPAHLSYPLAYERIAQLFDSPNAPDIAISPKSYAFGRQPGQHGSLDVVQARAPLVMSGPGVRPGVTDAFCAQVDIAPTLAKLLGLPLIDGKDTTGRTSSQRGVPPDVYLKRQDGKVIDGVLDTDAEGNLRSQPERVYIMLLDGMSNTELQERLEHDRESIPNLARLIERGAAFRYGTFVNFPSITWPSHNTLGSGAWCGHHDVVNPTYYLRETRQTVTPQGMVFDTAKFVSAEVETLFEAVHRVHGRWDGRTGVITASLNEPCVRGAAHATLERRMLVDNERFQETVLAHREDTNPRWKAEGQDGVHRYSYTDIQALAQALLLFGDPAADPAAGSQPPPVFTYQEFSLTDAVGHDYGPHHPAVLDALVECDKRIGKVLSVLDQRGLFDSTLFVITADHGMAPINTELAANQVQAVLDAGLKAVIPAPLVYLIDMEVIAEPAMDGRTVTMTVLENDADKHGEKAAVEGAEVRVITHGGSVSAEATTDRFGVAGLPLPVSEEPEHIVISVHHENFNPRHIRLDGSNVVEDVRARLYGGK
ncbi:MAG: alkaline phosphatase family protein [Dehalococcoidia bacterium]|nr:alkaline phosphatase family protein [Dehalococcoidia bacterium]